MLSADDISAGLKLRVHSEIFFIVGTRKNRHNETLLSSFEYPEHMLKLVGKKILRIIRSKMVFI